MPTLSQTTLLILRKAAESALPAAPKQPNPAPKVPKTPSFTTKPPTIGKAVADVRPGFASSVTTQTQSLGTAKSPNAKQVAVSKPVMTVREFRTAAPAIPLAKTAGLLSWLRDNVFLNGNVVNSGYRTMMGGTPAVAPQYFKPDTRAVRPSADISGDLNDSAKAVAASSLAHPVVRAAVAPLLGAYGATTSAGDAWAKARDGDYGGSARSLLFAIASGAFPFVGKYRLAGQVLGGSAGALGATDFGRALVYGREGMPGAAGAAATSAVADLSLLMPWSKSLRTILPAIAASSVARGAEEHLSQNAFNDRVKAVYDKALGPTVEAAKARLADAGVPDAAGVAKDIGEAASGAAHITDTAQPFSPTFLSGLTATKDLQYVKALEREASKGNGTAGSRSAATNARALIDRVLGKPGSLKAHLTSASGWLSRNGKWVLPAVGALTAGAAGLKLYNVLQARRKKKEQQ